LSVILLLALALRLAAGLSQDAAVVYADAGGDATWYLANGYALASGFDDGRLPGYNPQLYPDGYPIRLRSLPTPPLYLLFVGLPQMLFAPEAAIIVIRVIQALLGAVTCFFAYRLACVVSGDRRAGLITAGVLAVSPAFVLETAQITTETLYIFLIAAALLLYVELVNRRAFHPTSATPSTFWPLVLVGVLLGLATLTRAVLLLFPLGLALHLLLVAGMRSGLRRAALLLAVYGLVVGSWTVYNLARWNRFIIAGEGFAAFLYIGATGQGWQGGDATDEALAEQGALPPETEDQQAIYLENAQALIRSDPLGYLQRRIGQLANAHLQPHGTLLFGGAGIKELIGDWLREERTLSGLAALAQSPGFWPKLALYLLHYAGLILGLAGLWLMRRRWPVVLPLAGFMLYVPLIHLALDAIPRYIFPTTLFWWVFAGIALAYLWQMMRQPERPGSFSYPAEMVD